MNSDKDKAKNYHVGHRKRMHERVQTNGFDTLAEHEALEYLLYFTNAQKDTNEIGHALIERFHDFAGVLEASEKELCEVEGIGPTSARLLHLLPAVASYYARNRTAQERRLKTTDQLGRFLMAKFAFADYERAMLVSLDSQRRVRASSWLKEGSIDSIQLDIKGVVALAVQGGTESVVLAHNHPNGVAFPSREDLCATEEIARALGLVGICLTDHFILTDTEYFSMRDENRLPIYDFKTGTLFWPRGSFTL